MVSKVPAAPAAPAAPTAPTAPAAPAVVAPVGQAVALPPTTLAQVQALTPVRTRVNRQTGTRINLWAPLPNGPNGGGTGTWVVQCQNHNTVCNGYTTRKAAKATVYLPQHWCAGCAAHVAAVQAKAAAAPVAAPATPQAVVTPQATK